MKYIEVSKKIRLTKDASEDDLKQALIERFHRAFDIDHVKENGHDFQVSGTTGGKDSITRHASVNLNVSVKKQNEIVRIMVYGSSKMARSLMISYVALILLILVVGLLPGSIETGGEGSGALDALVFLIFGIFTFYDVNKKVAVPEEYLHTILESLDTEFG